MNYHIILIGLILPFLWLDKYVLGEFGLSQPIVMGMLVGLGTGSLKEGLMLGILLQPIWVSEFPLGKSVILDAQGASLAAFSSYTLLKMLNHNINIFLISLVSAMIGSVAGAFIDYRLRSINNYFLKRIEKETIFFKIALIHLSSISLYFAGGYLIGAIGISIGWIGFRFLRYLPTIPYHLLLLNSIFIGVVFLSKNFRFRKNWIQTLTGIFMGVLVWVLLKKP